jgi:hypothetical protein
MQAKRADSQGLMRPYRQKYVCFILVTQNSNWESYICFPVFDCWVITQWEGNQQPRDLKGKLFLSLEEVQAALTVHDFFL